MPRNSSKSTPDLGLFAPADAVDSTAGKASGQDAFRTDFTNDDLTDSRLRRIHAIWDSKRQPGRLPGRADIDPSEIPPDLLPYVVLIDVEDDRFRVRLAGTGLVSALDLEITGKCVDDLPNASSLVARLRWVVENAKPYFVADRPIPWAQDRFERYSVICMPLATNGTDVDKLLCMTAFDRPGEA